ncbi:MAG TPA: DUF3597 family protein [Anaerolineaceae bacterium]|nr:DUF3597 family protein [Anaerolineaceae bacterium]
MSIFGTILDKLGLKKTPTQTAPKTQAAPAKPAPPAASVKPPQTINTRPAPTMKPAQPASTPKPAQPPLHVGDSRPAPAGAPVPKRPEEAVERGAPMPAAPAVKPAPMEMVDVMSKLEGMAAQNPQKLNWKTSIVDLLKLLDMDSSYESRRELAIELGVPTDKMADSASMNTWLHKTVLQKIAENGGNIPKELLD